MEANPEGRSPDKAPSKLVNRDIVPEKVPLLGGPRSPLRTRRRFLVGPIVSLYIMGFIMCDYIVTEYTRKTWRDKEYARVHLKPEDISVNASCETNRSSLVYETETKVNSIASKWIMYFNVAQGCSSVVATIVLGSYTDVLGRKFLLTAATLGTSVRLLLSAVIFYMELGVHYLLIAYFIDGCTGQMAAILQAATTYMCDITEHGKQRTRGVIYVEVMMGFGMTASSFLAGYLIQEFSYLVAILTASGMLILNLVIILTLLPESYRKEKRTSNRKSLLNVAKQSFRFFTENDSNNNRWKYWILLIAHALCMIGSSCRTATEILYQMAEPFCWTAEQVGIYGTLRVVAELSLGLAALQILQNFLDSALLAALARCSYALAFYLQAIASTDLLLYIALGVNFLGPVGTVMTRSIVSQLTSSDRQGAIFAAFGAVEVLCSLLSAVQTSAVYAATVAKMRGLVFLVLGSYEAVSTVLLL